MTDDLEVALRQLLADDAASQPNVAGLRQWQRRRSLIRRAFPVAAAAAVVALAVGIAVSTQRGSTPAVQSPHPTSSAAPDVTSSPPPSTAPSTAPTDTAVEDTSAAAATMRRWISSVPVYPGATSAEGPHPTTPRSQPSIEGWFALSQSWVAPTDFRTTVAWYRGRIAAVGFTGRGSIGDADQFQIEAPASATDRRTLYAGTLTLTINDTGSATSVTLQAAGAPVPLRPPNSDIPLDEITSGTIFITPAGSPVPEGYEPKKAITVTVNAEDRARLATLLNDATIQPVVIGSGVGFGYLFTVTLRTGNGDAYTVRYSSDSPLTGPVLELPDRRSITLDPARSFVSLLKTLGGVSP